MNTRGEEGGGSAGKLDSHDDGDTKSDGVMCVEWCHVCEMESCVLSGVMYLNGVMMYVKDLPLC